MNRVFIGSLGLHRIVRALRVVAFPGATEQRRPFTVTWSAICCRAGNVPRAVIVLISACCLAAAFPPRDWEGRRDHAAGKRLTFP